MLKPGDAQRSGTQRQAPSLLAGPRTSGVWVCVWNWMIQRVLSSTGILIPAPLPYWDCLPVTAAPEQRWKSFPACSDGHSGGAREPGGFLLRSEALESGFALRGIWANGYSVSHHVN